MSAREHCYECDKVASLCLCGRVPRVDNRTGVTIVQHRLEARHPFGTVRIARLGLERLALHVVAREPQALDLPPGAAVLFPDEGAPALSDLPAAARPAHLVAIDGTWSQASQLRRNHPSLAGLPAVTLPPGPPSRYRIRREPDAQSISTIEAIVRALEILEPETEGLTGLLDSFDAMIDDQLTRRSRHAFTPRHRERPRVKKPLPEVFRAGPEAMALVYAEQHRPRGQRERFPLRVTVARAAPRRLVDALLHSPLPAAPCRIINMELGALGDAGRNGVPTLSRAALAAALGELVRPTDTLVAWAQSPEPLLRELGLEQPFLSAKHYYASERGGRLGTLDDVVEDLDDDSPLEPWVPGRAGREIAQLHRVVSAMRRLAVDSLSR